MISINIKEQLENLQEIKEFSERYAEKNTFHYNFSLRNLKKSPNVKDEKEKYSEIEKEKNKLKEIFENEKYNLNLYVFFLFF